MCGIAGIASLDPVPVRPEALKRMCDAIAHRGPDDAGYVYLRTGPYNFPELREQLLSEGYHFRSRSDTEVILHLWHRHGEAALGMLDGMFAFAVYDRVDNRLWLARDRFGVKPLYYAAAGGCLLFASE